MTGKYYSIIECCECGKEMILITEDYVKNKEEIVCSYCVSEKIKVTGQYDGLKECLKNKEERR